MTTRNKIWDCKIGEVDAQKLPPGADLPMRKAVAKAFYELTGEEPEFIFSGWGAQLTEDERDEVKEHDQKTSEPELMATASGVEDPFSSIEPCILRTVDYSAPSQLTDEQQNMIDKIHEFEQHIIDCLNVDGELLKNTTSNTGDANE